MTCKTNKVKCLYLYIVLAVVVVLILFSNSREIMVRMIVAGSSASLHQLRDAQVNRQLRSSMNMKEEIYGGGEERVNLDINAFPIENSIAALKSANGLEDKINTNMEGLLENIHFQNWAKYMDIAYDNHHAKAALAKISKLITFYGENKVIEMLKTGKDVDATRPIVEHLELGLALKWTSEGKMDDGIGLLARNKNDATSFLGSQSLKDWIDYFAETMNENPYSLLLTKFFLIHYREESLAEKFVVAKNNGAAKNVATELEKQLIQEWLKRKDSGEDGETVFGYLGLILEGVDSPTWDTWVSYLVKLCAGKEIGQDEENELVVSVLRGYFQNDNYLKKWLIAARNPKGEELATILTRTLENPVIPIENAEELESDMAKFDGNMEGLLDSAVYKMWAKNVIQKSKTQHDHVGANIAIISALITRFDEEKVRHMLAAGKSVSTTRPTAEHLELGLALKWTQDERLNDVFDVLAAGNRGVIETMGSQLVKDWIYCCENRLKVDPYSLLLKRLSIEQKNEAFIDFADTSNDYLLAKRLAMAKEDDAAKFVATKLEKLLIDKWATEEKSISGVFKGLGLQDTGIDIFDSPMWDTWVSYVVKVNAKEHIGEEDKYSLVLDVANELLDKSSYAAKTPKGLHRAIALAAARHREELARLRRKRPGENVDGEAPATSRQRLDDGQ